MPLGALRPTDWPEKFNPREFLEHMASHCARAAVQCRERGDSVFEQGYYEAMWIAQRLSVLNCYDLEEIT